MELDIFGDNMKLCVASSTALSTKESRLVRRALLNAHVVGWLRYVRASGITGQIQTALFGWRMHKLSQRIAMQFVICIANQGRGRKHGVGLGAPRQQLKRSALQRSPRPCNQALTTAEWKSL